MVEVVEEEANVSVEKSPNFEFNGINVEGSEQSGDKPCPSSNSVTRTNTVNFSQNGFLEEILKTTQPHLLEVEKIGKLQRNSNHMPPGFENYASKNAELIPKYLDGCPQPEISQELSHPPGFDSPVRLDLSICESLERREEGKKATKKQLKDNRKKVLMKKRASSRSSSRASNSCQRIAKEYH